MTNAEHIAALLPILHGKQTFLVTAHARPDGDAIGSALGLMHLLEGFGKTVTVAFADQIPPVYRFLPGVDRIVHQLPAEVPDVAVLLECGSVPRSGFPAIPAEFCVNIDHHKSSQRFADFNWIDPEAAAVGVMLYDVAIAAGANITPELATCLYTAVLTDTGSFTYSSTSASTFALAEHLLQCGASASQIAQSVYHSNPPSKLRLLGIALSNMRIDGNIAWSSISLDEMARAGADTEDSEGVVSYLIGMDGIDTAVFLREQAGSSILRLSLRSKGRVDVAKVAEQFGGGGHRNASGCSLPAPFGAAVPVILAALHAASPAPVTLLA